jgi:hypothetical protein
LVLELSREDSFNGAEGYKTGNALRRVPVHQQLIEFGFLDFWDRQQALGHSWLFPDWAQHIEGAKDNRPEVHFEADFFNSHRLKWGVPVHRARKTTFHSFRGFFIEACHAADMNPYTILKMVGHDEGTEVRTSEVHRGYLSQDLTPEEVQVIDRVTVPLGPMHSFGDWLKRQ